MRLREIFVLTCLIFSFGFAIAEDKVFQRAKKDDEALSDVFSSIGDNYGKHLRPNYMQKPTKIALDITIDSIGEINSIRKTVKITIYLRQRWKDYRYTHNLTTKMTPNLATHGHPANYIWVPDTTLINMKGAKRHTKNDKLDIFPDGTIFWATMLTMEIKCDMKFHDFPIDTQTCIFGFESYSYNADHVVYEWHGTRIHFVSTDVEQFLLKNYSSSTTIEQYEAGRFSTLKVYMSFERQLPVTILQIFFPAVLVVCVSWVTLWMHKRSPSARIGLGTTTLLTLTMIWLSANKKIPKVSYVKAIDIYFMISFCFILGVLFEYVLVTNINFAEWKVKHEERDLKRKRRKKRSDITDSATSALMEMKLLKEQSLEIARKSSIFGLRNDGRHRRIKKANDILREKTTYQEMLDEGFDLEPELEKSDSESECSDDDAVGTKNSIFLDKRVISMFLNTRPSTLDIICRFMFPFCYLCFAFYWWLYYMSKRANHETSWCADLENTCTDDSIFLIDCQNHFGDVHD